MRVGFYGGLANNAYVFAKYLAETGTEVRFVRDRNDTYPFSQPVWEDVSFTLDYSALGRPAELTWKWWTDREKQLDWKRPAWLADPWTVGSDAAHAPSNKTRWWLLELLAGRSDSRAASLALLRECDALFVCGIEGLLLAAETKRQFIFWPHGGDLRLAAGLAPVPPGVWAGLKHRAFVRLLRSALTKARCVGTHDPKGVGGHLGDAAGALGTVPLCRMPIPVRIGERAEAGERRTRLASLLDRLGCPVPSARHVGFVPARIDFYWKGHDRLLEALADLAQDDSLHLVFSGWGMDYEKAVRLAGSGALGRYCTFLPCAISKPLMYGMYSASDFVVDQFNFGTYGTSMVEAMSVGCPVLMWIDEPAFARIGWDAPPVINVRSSTQIRDALRAIARGSLDLEQASAAALAWVRRVHGWQAATRSVMMELASVREASA